MKKIQLPEMKRGVSFEYQINVTKNGTPYDVDLEDIRAEVRTQSGKLLAECSKEKMGIGIIRFYVEDTNNWPIGIVESDYDVKIDGKTLSSPTYYREVEKDITRPKVGDNNG